jgi:hypothetical protein
MMMEEEIERTLEEIKRIQEACDKVEQVLEKVVQSGDLDGNSLEQVLKSGEDGKMEDIVQEAKDKDSTREKAETEESKWFEDDKLLKLWNGDVT